MSITTKLTPEHAGKFAIVRADERKILVKIISVGDGMVGCSVLNPNISMRSFKMRYNVDTEFEVFDTDVEAKERASELS